MSFIFAIESECPEIRSGAFFEALHDSSVRRLADEAAQTAARLSADFGRIAEIRHAVLLAESSGASVADTVRARIGELRLQREGMQRHIDGLDRFTAEQRERFRTELSRCAATLLDGPTRIEVLRAKIRGYSRSRDEMATRLREAGLGDIEIQRAGLKPTPDHLAAWNAEIEGVELAVRLAREFIASGPLYDVSLLSGMRNV